jgi:RNA recognition motif-containing protein
MAKKLFVGGIPFSCTNETLKAHFASVGAVESASIIMDRATGRSKGFGFVEMVTDEDAQQAIDKLNGSDLEGRTINVSEARPMTERPQRESRDRRW